MFSWIYKISNRIYKIVINTKPKFRILELTKTKKNIASLTDKTKKTSPFWRMGEANQPAMCKPKVESCGVSHETLGY